MLALLALPTHASAQFGTDTTIDANVLWLPAGPSEFTTQRSADISPHLVMHYGFALGYQHRPLVLEQEGQTRGAVDYQVTSDINVAIGLFDRLQLGVGIPLVVAQNGVGASPITTGSATGGLEPMFLRDLHIALDVMVLDRLSNRPGVLLSAGVSAPTGDRDNFASAGQWVLAPQAVVDYRVGPMLLALDLSARIHANDRELGAAKIGSSVVIRPGALYALPGNRLGLSLEGTVILRTAGQPAEANRNQHVYELDLGVRLLPAESLDFTVVGSLGAGFGGIGAPAVRALVGLQRRFEGSD